MRKYTTTMSWAFPPFHINNHTQAIFLRWKLKEKCEWIFFKAIKNKNIFFLLLKMYAFAVSLTLIHALLNCKNKFFFVIFSSSHHTVLSSLSVKNFPLFANEKHLTDNFSSDNYFQQQRKTYECMHAKWVRMFKTFLEQWYLELHNKSRFFCSFAAWEQ